jgi:hypothetical protein
VNGILLSFLFGFTLAIAGRPIALHHDLRHPRRHRMLDDVAGRRQRGTPGAAARPRDLSRLFVATLLRTGQSVDDRGVHDVRSAAAAWQLGLHDGAVCSEPVFRAGLFRDPGRLSLLNSASGAAIAAFGILGLMNV